MWQTSLINTLQIGLLSPEDVKNIAVCEITSSLLRKDRKTNTLYDPRLGCDIRGSVCNTCCKDYMNCGGHLGYIKLNYPLLHVLYYNTIVSILNAMCEKCGCYKRETKELMTSQKKKCVHCGEISEDMYLLNKK